MAKILPMRPQRRKAEEVIVFRDLPGIQRVEEIFRNPWALAKDRQRATFEALNDISNSLFCVREYDTLADDDLDEEALEKYELPFDVCDLPWDEARPFWEAIGWDISDGRGNEYPYAHYFTRQIIAATRSLMVEARFCPDGSGVAAFHPWGGKIADEQQFETALQAEVDRFFKNRR